MIKILNSGRYARFCGSLGRYLSAGPARRPAARPARTAITLAGPRLIRKALAKLLRRGRKLGRSSPAEAMHAFRVRCKRIRYLCEFLGDLYDPPAGRLAARLIKVQDALGTVQDSIVGQALLAEFIARNGRPSGGVHLGHRGLDVLAGWYIANTERARQRFVQAWKRFDRKKLRRPLEEVMARLGRPPAVQPEPQPAEVGPLGDVPR
jgi:CHAD domain-containing protein